MCEYLIDENIEDTDTDGYKPSANSRVERRNRSIKGAFKAAPFYATGGLSYYNALWGPGLKFATCAVNNNDDSSGRNYYMDPDTKIYKRHPTVHVNNVRYGHIVYPLKMGPVYDSMTDTERETNFDTYVEGFFRPWYKVTECNEDYQIEGEDPI